MEQRSWPSWISARIRSHKRTGPSWPNGSPEHRCDGATVLHLVYLSQTSASSKRLIQGRAIQSLAHHSRCSWFISAVLAQHAPGNPRQLVGQSRREHVVMQPRRSRREPVPETVLGPLGWPKQQHAGGLDQQGTQISVAALGQATQDRAVAR